MAYDFLVEFINLQKINSMEQSTSNSKKHWIQPQFSNLNGKETHGGSLGNVSEGGHVTDSNTTFTGMGLLT
jgi:hypothetical protein